MLVFLTLLSVSVPSLRAMTIGAPIGACADLMPQHGVDGAPNNTGFFLLSEVIDNGSYEPGQTYGGKVIARVVVSDVSIPDIIGTERVSYPVYAHGGLAIRR